MENKKEIIKIINDISGKYSPYEVFTDWTKCCALAISNPISFCHDKVWEDREQAYINTMRKYTPGEQRKMSEMLAFLVEALENEMTDILGQIYMESGMGNKTAGQFFTPYHINKLCAKLSLPKADKNEKYVINEPSCGGGGMIIAVASALRDKGIDYQKNMEVVAQDLDWKGIYMCYIQLSLLGIKAICIQGNTLAQEKVEASQILITPAKMGVLL